MQNSCIYIEWCNINVKCTQFILEATHKTSAFCYKTLVIQPWWGKWVWLPKKRTLNTSYLYGNFCGIWCLHKSPEADFLKSIVDNGRGFWKNWKWFSVFPPTQLVTLKSSKLIQLLLLLHLGLNQVLSLCIQTAMMQELDMSLYVVFGTGVFSVYGILEFFRN